MPIGLTLAAVLLAVTLPDEARGPDDPMEMTELAPGAVMYEGYGGNVTALKAGDGVVLVDLFFPESAGEVIARAQTLFGGRVDAVINTHHHADHARGDAVANADGIPTIAHAFVRERLATRRFSESRDEWIEPRPVAELPRVTYEGALTLHDLGADIRLIHMPNAHTGGDTVVQATGPDVIATGDVFFHGVWPIIDVAAGGSVDGVLAALDEIAALADAETTIVPGHGPVADRGDLVVYRTALSDMRETTLAALAAGETREAFVARDPFAGQQPEWKAWFVTSADVADMFWDSLAGE